ncbi:hypothetical protein AB1J28_04440 [Lysinibacillus irui]|uniref:hypothetical protein n=1 Tax=Lysinibacillus TaxID=400634 RepID=UPI00289785F7|nr:MULTISPECIES: hypothetical protein [Lysinibacillus]MEA0563567.1 hypothetical protein [Lysinibacillus irui]
MAMLLIVVFCCILLIGGIVTFKYLQVRRVRQEKKMMLEQRLEHLIYTNKHEKNEPSD